MSSIIDARVRVPARMFPEGLRVPAGLLDGYEEVLNAGTKNAHKDEDALLEAIDEAGIDTAIVHAEYEFGDPADALTATVSELVARYPDKLYGFGTISLDDVRPARTVGQVTDVADRGLLGINIQPGFFGLAIDDRRLYPAYAGCEQLGLTVAVHTGVNYARSRPIALETPLMIDQLAADFPDLKVIACHAAWPWATEMAAVARRHPNVSFDFGGMAPKYVARSGTGWDALFGLVDNLLAGQAMFASDWPTFAIGRARQEWDAVTLKPEMRDALMGGNAQRLIDERVAATAPLAGPAA